MRLLRKTICLLLVFANLNIVTSVFADDTVPEPIAAPQPAVFSVTVPTNLPISMDGVGNIQTSTSAAVINNSDDTIEIVDIDINPTGAYTIVGYDESFAFKPIDSNQFAMRLNGINTNSDGSFIFDKNKFVPIATGGKCPISYSVKLTPSVEAHTDVHIADVVFTLDWYNKKILTYDATGGVFTNGAGTNLMVYTDTGLFAGGLDENPTRTHCTFEGWFTDTNYTTQFIREPVVTQNASAFARWSTTYKVQHILQSLDISSDYYVESEETFTAYLGDWVNPGVKYYDHYQQPSSQWIQVDDSGNCVVQYRYDRTTFWVDVNFIFDGVETGGGHENTWPADLVEDIVNVFIDGVQVGWGKDFCEIYPWLSTYDIKLTLPERYYYVGPSLEGADYWDDGTTLYRCEDSGVITENIGARLIVKSVTPDMSHYTIHFDPNGGVGYTPVDMEMYFNSNEHEINWLYQHWLSKDGYYFAGWSRTPDGDVEFTDMQKITRLSETDGEVINLYAVWKPY